MLPVYVAVTRTGRGLAWLDGVAPSSLDWGRCASSSLPTSSCTASSGTGNPGNVMDRGLWSWSRHPNYFGEFGFWFALALFGVAASPADAWWLIARGVNDAGACSSVPAFR